MRRVVVVLLVLGGLGACSGDDVPQTATTPTTSAPVTSVEVTTAVEVLSLSDKGFSEACADRTLDMMEEGSSSTAEPNVAGYITWLHHSAFAQLHELADDLGQIDPAGVEAAVNQLTRLCAEAGYELP